MNGTLLLEQYEIVWVFPFSYVPWRLWGRIGEHEPAPQWQRPSFAHRSDALHVLSLPVQKSNVPLRQRPSVLHFSEALHDALVILQLPV